MGMCLVGASASTNEHAIAALLQRNGRTAGDLTLGFLRAPEQATRHPRAVHLAVAAAGVLAVAGPVADRGAVVAHLGNAPGRAGTLHVAPIAAGKLTPRVALADQSDVILALDYALGPTLAGAGACVLVARAGTLALENLHVVVATAGECSAKNKQERQQPSTCFHGFFSFRLVMR